MGQSDSKWDRQNWLQAVQRHEPCECVKTPRGSQTLQDQTMQPVLLSFQCLVHEEEDKELWWPWHISASPLWVTMVESLCCPPAQGSFTHFTLDQKTGGDSWTKATTRKLELATRA